MFGTWQTVALLPFARGRRTT